MNRVDVVRRLTVAGVPTPDVDARLLLRHGDPDRLDELVARRETREPLQLILGSVGFRYLDVEVRAGVFVPRPETEVLAGEAIARAPAGGVVVEPCTGTGAVAVSIATEADAAVVHATDLSSAAVELARANAAAAGAAVTVHAGDLLVPLPARLRGRVDVVVANPPYVAEGEIDGLEPEVVAWDPPEAIVAGPSGHEITDRLIDEAPSWLAPGGWLLLETADTRAHETADRARTAGYSEVAVVADLTGRPRVVVARWTGAGRGKR